MKRARTPVDGEHGHGCLVIFTVHEEERCLQLEHRGTESTVPSGLRWRGGRARASQGPSSVSGSLLCEPVGP